MGNEGTPIGNEESTNKAKNGNKKRNKNRNRNKKTETKEQNEPKPVTGGEEVRVEKSQAKNRRRKTIMELNKRIPYTTQRKLM